MAILRKSKFELSKKGLHSVSQKLPYEFFLPLMIFILTVITWLILNLARGDGLRTKPEMVIEEVSEEEQQFSVYGASKFDPRVAFLFLVKDSIPLAPLWSRFFYSYEDLYSIYVLSTLEEVIPQEKLPRAFHGTQIPIKNAGSKALAPLDAKIQLLSFALLDLRNERFVFVTSACLPLYNFTTIYSYLINTNVSFVEAYDQDTPQARGRYKAHYLPEIKAEQWRKGSEWITLTKSHAMFFVNDKLYYPKFKRFCVRYCYPDEHYFSTVLTVTEPGLIANRSLTWLDWSRGGFQPRTFDASQVNEELVKKMRGVSNCTWNSLHNMPCYLFAMQIMPDALNFFLDYAIGMGF